jgi:hypothetical protein
MNFLKEKKSTTERDPKEERVIKIQKKIHKSMLINPPNSRIKSWDWDNSIKKKQRKPWSLFVKKKSMSINEIEKKISNKKLYQPLLAYKTRDSVHLIRSTKSRKIMKFNF